MLFICRLLTTLTLSILIKMNFKTLRYHYLNPQISLRKEVSPFSSQVLTLTCTYCRLNAMNHQREIPLLSSRFHEANTTWTEVIKYIVE